MSVDFSSVSGIPRSPKVPMSPEMKVAVRKAGIDLGGIRSHSNRRESTSRSSTPISSKKFPNISSNGGGFQIYRQRSTTPASKSPRSAIVSSRSPSPAMNSRAPSPANDSHALIPALNVRGQSPLVLSRLNPTPVASFKSFNYTDSRDEYSSFDYNPDQMEEMDDVLIQRYLSEKRKRKTLEANCASLTNEIDLVQRTMENRLSDVDKDRIAAEAQLEEQEKMTTALHSAVKNLQTQFSRQAKESEDKIITIREDADKQIVQLREDASERVAALRTDVVDYQAKYSKSQKTLELGNEKLAELENKFKALESNHEAGGIILEAEKKKSAALTLKLKDMDTHRKVSDEINEGRTNVLSTELKQMREKLEFEGGKAQGFSGELKLLSCQYVVSVEQISDMEKTIKTLSRALETKGNEFKRELRRCAHISNQLEEMATGFIESDEMLQKERASTDLLTTTTTDLKERLETEVLKSNQLANEVASIKASRAESNGAVKTLHISCDTLANELFETTEKVTSEVAKSAALSHRLEESKKGREETQAKLKKEEERAAVMSLELIEVREEVISYAKKLTLTKAELQESQASHDMLNNDLKLMEEDFQDIDAALQQTIEENEKTLTYEQEKSASLIIELEILKDIHRIKMELLSKAEKNLESIREKYDSLANKLSSQTKEYHDVKTTLEKEKEVNEVKLKDEHNKMTTVAVEADNMKNQYMSLFDNLVETEERLDKSRDEVEAMKKTIDGKDREIRQVKWNFDQTIDLKERSLRKEQENEKSIADKLEEVQQQGKGLYIKLVEAEEQLLDKEEDALRNKEKIKEKDSECQLLKEMLKKEKKGVPQRKLRVAKKMIHAEKERQKLLLGEIEAKEVIFKRTIDQVDELCINLKKTQDLLALERVKKATHSSRAIQELHEQLEEERKKAKAEKDQSEAMLNTEQIKSDSYATRLLQLEETPDTETLSKALGEKHDLSQTVKALKQQNTQLQRITDQKNKEKRASMTRLSEMQDKLNAVTHSMDTLTMYCNELEGEKKKLQQDVIAKKNLQPLLTSLNFTDDLLTLGPISFSDDDESRGENSVLSWTESISAPLALVKEHDENQDRGNSCEDQNSTSNSGEIETSKK